MQLDHTTVAWSVLFEFTLLPCGVHDDGDAEEADGGADETKAFVPRISAYPNQILTLAPSSVLVTSRVPRSSRPFSWRCRGPTRLILGRSSRVVVGTGRRIRVPCRSLRAMAGLRFHLLLKPRPVPGGV